MSRAKQLALFEYFVAFVFTRFLAGRLGFEPRQSAPKALDLPLVDRPRLLQGKPSLTAD